MSEIKNIKKEKLTDQIYQTVKSLILSGEWKSGYCIPSETELAERFGVSRMSVRMALQRLVAMGLLDVRVGEGTIVKEFKLGEYIAEIGSFILRSEDLKEIAEFRRAFEIETLRLAIEKYDENQLMILKSYLNELLEAVRNQDNEAFIQSDFRFHRYICTISGNSLFEIMYDLSFELMLHFYRVNREHSYINDDSDLDNEYHVLLFKAISERNFEKAKKIYLELIDYPLNN